jgi:predicted transcriptional regulator
MNLTKYEVDPMAVKKIDDTIKKQVIQKHVNGVSKKQIAEIFGISVSSVSRIIKENPRQDVPKGVVKSNEKTERQKKIEDIERRIALLEKKVLEREARTKG